MHAQSGNAIINFTRSAFDPETGISPGNPRQQINEISTYIDASNVYGSDAVRQAALRAEGGKLKTSDGDLLPYNVDGLPNAHSTSARMFLAGDERANENVALISMHTLFVREHNRLVDELKGKNPAWDAETLFQEAKRIVEAQIQSITYNEFLPKLLGDDALDQYDGYKFDVTPEIANVFSTAAFRLGHTMLSSTVHRTEEDGSESPFGDLALLNAFFRPDRISSEGGIDAILRGAGTSLALIGCLLPLVRCFDLFREHLPIAIFVPIFELKLQILRQFIFGNVLVTVGIVLLQDPVRIGGKIDRSLRWPERSHWLKEPRVWNYAGSKKRTQAIRFRNKRGTRSR